jgi:hypothetical protein
MSPLVGLGGARGFCLQYWGAQSNDGFRMWKSQHEAFELSIHWPSVREKELFTAQRPPSAERARNSAPT